MTRHVVCHKTNRYWNEAYRKIREFYKTEWIMIIDDASKKEFICVDNDICLYNCMIIQSEFPYAGEILSYYYFHKYKLFDTAVIIHDSTFIQKHIDFEKIKPVQFLWHFTIHSWDDPFVETGLLKLLDHHEELLSFYHQKHLWHGCFGVQVVIQREFLEELQSYFNFLQIVPNISNRVHRYALERVIGCIFTYRHRELLKTPSMLGNIFEYIKWNYQYEKYQQEKDSFSYPIIKVWSGR